MFSMKIGLKQGAVGSRGFGSESLPQEWRPGALSGRASHLHVPAVAVSSVGERLVHNLGVIEEGWQKGGGGGGIRWSREVGVGDYFQ